jgi:hypothetical protein
MIFELKYPGKFETKFKTALGYESRGYVGSIYEKPEVKISKPGPFKQL